jgi:hypothetical protein
MPISQSIRVGNGAQTPTSRGISLYFSLLAGNLRRRPVREGLRPQPSFPLDIGYLENAAMFSKAVFMLRHVAKNFQATSTVAKQWPHDMNATLPGRVQPASALN